ncbi:MAG: hypothetical protein PV340_03285 [Wolbachia sp.]|nr:hypothetical protein [Wolbachia sp.]MDD9336160.1 hypothetical protein [Wolbachia sp.]
MLTTLNPRYIVLVAIDEPQGMQISTGGIIAAPVVKSITSRVASILNIMPEM